MSQSGPDNITLPARGITATQVKLSVACELMKNQLRASPVPANDDIAVVEDAAGNPLLFTIGSNGAFDLIKPDPAAPSGMVVVNLLAGFTGAGPAKTFAVIQDYDGKIAVAVALTRAGSSATDIYVASRLDNDTAKTAWDNFSGLCFKLAGVDANFTAMKMGLGTGDDGNPPSIFIGGRLGSEVMYYQALDVTQGAARWELPDRATSDTLDMALGYAFGDRGLWFLYTAGDSQTLECTTIVPSGTRPLTFDYSPGNQHIAAAFPGLKYNCVETARGGKTDPALLSSDVFIGANLGVYVALGGKVSGGNFQKVTDQIRNVRQLVVREDGGNIAIWAMVSPNQIYYIYGKKGDGYTWNDPVLFSSSAIHIAPIRSQKRQANELFLVDQELTVHHYWQDPGSTLWQERLLKIGGAASGVVDFTSYTTHIHLGDETGVGMTDVALNVTASDWTFVTANGLVYSLDPDNPARIPADIMGNITIIYMASDISCPTLHLKSDFFDKTIHVYPNAGVQAGLESLHSAADLRNARGRDGQPVYSGSHDDATLNAVSSNVSQLSGSAGQFARRNGYKFVSVEDPRLLKSAPQPLLAALPENFAAGMTLRAGAWEPMDAAELQSQPLGAAGPWDAAIRLVGGDALHWLTNAFSDGIHYIQQGLIFLQDGVSFVLRKIGDGLRFVLSIAGKILDIALQTLGAVFKALNWVLKLIGIDLSAILRWLGDLIGWTGVLETSDKLIEAFNFTVDFVISHMGDIKHSCDELFSSAQRMIGGSMGDQFGESGNSRAGGGDNSLFQSPAVNWGLYQISHGNLFGDLDLGVDGAASLRIEQSMGILAGTEIFPSAAAAQRMVQSLVEGARNLSILELLRKVVEILAAAALQTVKAVVDAALDLAAVILNLLKTLGNKRVNIPILTSLVELFLDGREMTLMRALTILMAIPLRAIHLIVTGNSLDRNQMSFRRPLRARAAVAQGPQAPAPGAEAEPVTVPPWVLLTYEVSRLYETVCSGVNVLAYVGGKTSAVATRVMEEVYGLVATSMILYNIHRISGWQIDDFQWAAIAMSVVRLILFVVGTRNPAWKGKCKWVKVLLNALALIPLSIALDSSAKNRADNLRFSSSFFFVIHKMAANFPVQAGAGAAKAVVVVSSLFSATHISMIAARWWTDAEDHQTFRFV